MKHFKSPFQLAMDVITPASLNHFFNDAIQGLDVTQPKTSFTPRYEWTKSTDTFALFVDLPGIKKEDVEISLENNKISIKGKRAHLASSLSLEVLSSSVHYGDFALVFALPSQANLENLQAVFENGVLQLHIPILEKAQKQLVTIA